ncbi:MAG: type I secretion C-terminal target domain-containing protein [Luteolibacter sp.]|uniref:type I secretion C-terminal target domain-containing protein n=1 Tax=Luteolibacter sp. TaxID=1962973 RepID=UPI003263AFAD
MKKLLHLLTAALLPCLLAGVAAAAPGFTDSVVTFYGEVRQVGGAQTVLLQAGKLEMTFVNQSSPTNRVTLKADLRPTGEGTNKLFSYAIEVPLAYLPETPRIGEFLSIGAASTTFKIQQITIDGRAATLPDGSKEFYGLSFASRGSDYRLDLLVPGESLDSDGDGLPDWWEKLHGLDSNLADSDADPDNDGWTNLQEYNLGGDPNVSNRDPQLATAEILVSESGEAGVFLHVLDSDTQPAGIDLAFTGSPSSGFTLDVDGLPLAAGTMRHLTLADLQAGRLSIRHSNRALNQATLPVSWNDGGAMITGEVVIRVTTPSTRDGNDSTLWLDGMDLAAAGSPISTWPDRSGNNRNASQPLPALQPVVKDNSADFSASTSAHLFFQDAAISTSNHTVLAAYKAADSSDAPQTLLATNRGFLKVAPTSQAISYPGAPVYQMDGLATQGYVDISGKESTSTFRREGSLLQNVFGLSYDGQNIAAESIDPVLPTIGGRRPAIPNGGDPITDAFGGQLHELLVFPTALPEQKLRDVHDYLDSKWGGSIIWDLSTGLKAVSLSAVSATHPQIIRGGHGDDRLGGGPFDDTLSGGPGTDILTGGGGVDRFVFGGVDTGADRITDFDLEKDIIDLSALYWGQTGDARQSISVRLDANFSTATPTLDTVLIVKRPGGVTQEITLENKVVSSSQLIQLIVEGRIRMGGLSIPSSVQVALAPGSPTGPLTESLDQPFNIVVTRSGAGTAAALDVPLGFFENALGGHFVIDGAVENESLRSVVRFARGVTTKTLTVRPVPDLDTAGVSAVQVAVLPQFKYSVGGAPVERVIVDRPMVSLEVVQANAVSGIGQPASLLIHRDGDLSQGLTVTLGLGGTAKEGIHIQDVPDSVTIPAGQDSAEVLVTARAEGLTRGPKVVLFQLVPSNIYQLGNPNEAVLYVANTASEANGAGFDRWLQASTNGAKTKLSDLAGMSKEMISKYLQAYAFGLGSPDQLPSHSISFRVANGKPEILTNSPFKAADVNWGVESSSTLGQWSDNSSTFSEATDPTGLKLVGQTLPAQAKSRFYRLSMKLEPGELATTSITELAGTTRFGISGNSTWKTNQSTGDLNSSGGNAGDTSRIIAEVSGTTNLNFEMQVPGGGSSDLLVFYIDGVKQSQTTSAAVAIQRQLTGSGTHLLMWEFKRGTGNAVIRNLAK